MEKLGLIGGSMLFESGFLADLKGKEVETEYGKVSVLEGENLIYIPRHGKNNNVPPHKINHLANMAVFKELGVKKIIGLSSVNSLKSKIGPNTIVIPDDYIDFNCLTYFDREIQHVVPGLDKELRNKIISIAKKEKIVVVDLAVYFQIKGPRLETKAEVNMIKNYAQIVGMTLAHEATLAKELELQYAAVCLVGDYAKGIVKKELTLQQVEEIRKKNTGELKKFVEKIIVDFIKKEEKKKEETSGKIYDFIKTIRGK